MLKDIPQDLVTIWQRSVGIIPEGIYEMLRIGACFASVTLKGPEAMLRFHQNIDISRAKTFPLIPLSVTYDSSFSLILNCSPPETRGLPSS